MEAGFPALTAAQLGGSAAVWSLIARQRRGMGREEEEEEESGLVAVMLK